jgi:lysophospholipase L1-like esterase
VASSPAPGVRLVALLRVVDFVGMRREIERMFRRDRRRWLFTAGAGSVSGAWSLASGGLLSSAGVLACSARGAAPEHPVAPAELAIAETARAWIPAWVSAQQLTEPNNMPPAPGFAGAALRQIVQPALGGSRVRVTFSNAYGDRPLTLRAAHVAASEALGAIGRGAPLTFDGKGSVTIQPGATMVSDAVELDVRAFANLAVSIGFDDAPPQAITGHPGSRTTSFFAPGADVAAVDASAGTAVDHWYFLSRVDVWADAEARAVVAIGDSITDGRGSTTNQNDRWPNRLARRLQANPATALVSVLNQGIGGNRILRDGIGPNLLGRFERDVLALPGVRWLIVLAGINDIGTAAGAREAGQPAATAADLIAAYRQMILRAHDHGIQVYGATILPFEGFSYFSAQGEADRQTINQWMRSSGELDQVIDFDAVARDPSAPSRLSAAVDGGDHLHPSAAGYGIMADAIDLRLFV